MNTFPSQAEIEQHLAAFTDAWKRYMESYGSAEPQLGNLHATWECNKHLAWLHARGLHLWRDIIYEPKLGAFILTEAIIS